MMIHYLRLTGDFVWALSVFVYQAVRVLARRAINASGRTRARSSISRPLMGLLLVSLLLVLHAAPGGSATADESGLRMSAAGACGHPVLGQFANCGSGLFLPDAPGVTMAELSGPMQAYGFEGVPTQGLAARCASDAPPAGCAGPGTVTVSLGR